ncbi:MAG: hypothetical protein ACRDT6_07065 [Micromonosporaceae bacterium]
MRKRTATFIGAMVVALGAAATLTSVAAAETTSTATYNACNQTLNPDRRQVYRLTNGGNVLSYGRVVVTATQRYYHRYCVKFQTGGRKVLHSWGQAGYNRIDGRCEYEGAKGSGAYWTYGYKRTVIVPDKYCIRESYSIKHNGKWWTASFLRYNA